MKTAISSLVGVTLLATSVMPTLPELTPALLNTTAFASSAPVAGAGLPVMPADSDVDPALTQTVTGNEKVAPKGERVEISAGHVDMGATLSDSFELMARDDTTPEPVWRHLDDVVFVIGEEGKLTVPDDPAYAFTKAEGQAWVIPQHEIEGVPWLGWNTQHPQLVEKAPGGVDLIFEGHEGPGVLTTFVEAGNFSGPQVIWDSTKEQGQLIHVEPSTHTHVSWVFTQPGEHLVRVTAQATIDGELVSNTQTLRFAVGPDASVEAAHELAWSSHNPAGVANPKNEGEAGDSAAASSAQQSGNGLALSVGIGVAIAVLIIAVAAVVMGRMSRSRKKEAMS
ncbi:MAG: choice-of-anchor M domain-containing protein [Actinomyces sp.]|uniref:choice-of-anchor M domain-containing protein n=1 Tax=Actinomyces sp. HMSC075B09 TaxID=1739358 RepID=UPI0008B64BC2|nr:choice-of-anchor M domain-containing protein [Actinomyces sp. HMSC075B09]MBS6102176.1 choice-of-anchor M domain-containing protein [Actinomyces sp.]MDU4832071.1 choice-of-anchor M domain-containing protein [Actinomyces sp.]OFJ61638.1 hypothetical protein HMPREF2854_06920 [Actinomyces sp. HMSC075B09]